MITRLELIDEQVSVLIDALIAFRDGMEQDYESEKKGYKDYAEQCKYEGEVAQQILTMLGSEE